MVIKYQENTQWKYNEKLNKNDIRKIFFEIQFINCNLNVMKKVIKYHKFKPIKMSSKYEDLIHHYWKEKMKCSKW